MLARLQVVRDPFTGAYLVPDSTTIGRLLARIDAGAFDAAIGRWLITVSGQHRPIPASRQRWNQQLVIACLAAWLLTVRIKPIPKLTVWEPPGRTGRDETEPVELPSVRGQGRGGVPDGPEFASPNEMRRG